MQKLLQSNADGFEHRAYLQVSSLKQLCVVAAASTPFAGMTKWYGVIIIKKNFIRTQVYASYAYERDLALAVLDPLSKEVSRDQYTKIPHPEFHNSQGNA